jgi:hypothetical protein
MSVVNLAEAAVIRRGFSRPWATTTTTTIEDEQPDISIASEVAPHHSIAEDMLVAWITQRMFRPVPPSTGKVLLFEGAPEQVGLFEDAIGSSRAVPHYLASPAWNSLLAPPHHRALLPSMVYRDEVLNWDVAIDVPPERRSGTLTVTLKYAGRDTPTPVEDPWD